MREPGDIGIELMVAGRELADRITEDVLQLLFTVHQDLAELAAAGTAPDAALLASAQECTLGAITTLRTVASAMADAARGPQPTPSRTEVPDDRRTSTDRSASTAERARPAPASRAPASS